MNEDRQNIGYTNIDLKEIEDQLIAKVIEQQNAQIEQWCKQHGITIPVEGLLD